MAKADTQESVTLIFDKEKPTKNKTRFKEDSGDNEPIIGILYLTKVQLKKMGEPDKLHVVITVV